MVTDSNRGRDFPQAPRLVNKGWPKNGPTGDPMEDAKRRRRVSKQLKKIIDAGGYYTLFGKTNVAADPEKDREKKRKVVLEALAFRLDEKTPIPRELLEEVGLTPEETPRVPDFDETEIPF